MKRTFLRSRVVMLAVEVLACGLLLSSNCILAQDEWTIGIYTGASPFELSPPANVNNPVLTAADVTDLDIDILANPFIVAKNSRYFMFFTAKNSKTEKGGIGLAESSDGLNWKYRRAVVEGPYPVSYPFVFEWQNDYYMVPETYKETSIRLYKATRFPDKWEYQGDLLAGEHYTSPTLLRHNDKWWLFATPPGNETLRLFYSNDLKGPWTEHPQSPVVEKDLNTGRSGGRPFVMDGRLYRVGQDCFPTYGNQVHAFEITEMSPTTYSEKMVEAPLIGLTSKGWNGKAMHHIDAHQIGKNKWLAGVDALGKP